MKNFITILGLFLTAAVQVGLAATPPAADRISGRWLSTEANDWLGGEPARVFLQFWPGMGLLSGRYDASGTFAVERGEYTLTGSDKARGTVPVDGRKQEWTFEAAADGSLIARVGDRTARFERNPVASTGESPKAEPTKVDSTKSDSPNSVPTEPAPIVERKRPERVVPTADRLLRTPTYEPPVDRIARATVGSVNGPATTPAAAPAQATSAPHGLTVTAPGDLEVIETGVGSRRWMIAMAAAVGVMGLLVLIRRR